MFFFLKTLLNKAKKAIIVLAVFMIVINVFINAFISNKPHSARAAREMQRNTIYQSIQSLNKDKTQVGKLRLLTYQLTTCQLIGEGCNANPLSKDNNFQNSLFGNMSTMIATPISHPPASGVAWAAQQFSNAGFLPKSLAYEGVGFAALQPFQGLWKIFRDIAFMLLVIIMLVIGFMIMFRVKINPQTVISIENSLPRIAIAMILITFSYAIAGFLIDIMYVVMALIIALLSDSTSVKNVAELQNQYLGGGFNAIWDSMWPKAGFTGGFILNDFLNDFLGHSQQGPVLQSVMNIFSIGNALYGILPDVIQNFVYVLGWLLSIFLASRFTQPLVPLLSSFNGFEGFGTGVGDLPGGILFTVLTIAGLAFIVIFIIPFVIGLIVFLTIMLAIIRIFFLLLMSYIRLLLIIFFAPVILLFEAVPGRNVFGFWIKGVIGELIAFPTVVLLFLASNIIINNINGTGVDSSPWQPPFLYSLNKTAFAFIVGMGITLIIPDVVKQVKKAIGAEGLPINFGAGTFFAGAGVAIGGALGLFSQYSSLRGSLVGPHQGILSAKNKDKLPDFFKTLLGIKE